MKYFTHPFDKLLSAGSAITGVFFFAGNVIVSSDAFQKYSLKANLSRSKLLQPRDDIMDFHYIKREDDLALLASTLPKTIQPNDWVMVGNSRGYGKSSLMKEFGSRHQGGVLFTDFFSANSPENMTSSLQNTIDRLFFDPYPLTIYADKSLRHRLVLLKEVAKELADEGRPVLWIMDSFSTLVSSAIAENANPVSIEIYKGFIGELFKFSTVLIPIPVCSSATTAGSLGKVNGHVAARTTAFFAPFVTDANELKEFVRSVIIHTGHGVVEEAIVQQIVDTAGSNFLELKRLAKCKYPMQAIQILVDDQTMHLRELLRQHKEAFEVLLKIAKGEIITISRANNDHLVLLSHSAEFPAFCAMHPSGHLILSMPVTKEALRIVQENKASWWAIWK